MLCILFIVRFLSYLEADIVRVRALIRHPRLGLTVPSSIYRNANEIVPADIDPHVSNAAADNISMALNMDIGNIGGKKSKTTVDLH